MKHNLAVKQAKKIAEIVNVIATAAEDVLENHRDIVREAENDQKDIVRVITTEVGAEAEAVTILEDTLVMREVEAEKDHIITTHTAERTVRAERKHLLKTRLH